MVRKTLVATLGVTAMILMSGCPADLINSLVPPIPIDVPEQSTTLGEIWTGASAVDGTEVAIPAVPDAGKYIKIPPNDTGIEIPVPAEAKDKTDKISSATVEFTADNKTPLPIKVALFLAKDKPFASTSLGTVEFKAASTSTGSVTIKTELLKETKLYLGMQLSSDGTGGTKQKIDSKAKLTLKPKAIIKLKLL